MGKICRGIYSSLSKMFTIGLTGGLGTGKSTVASMFRRLGAYTIDADKIVHGLLKSSGACRNSIVRVFGKGVVHRGEVDRRVLANIVFSDSQKLKKLEAILHPAAWKKAREEIKKLKDKRRLIAIDAPLLIEAGWHRRVDVLIVVYARVSQQIARVQKRRSIAKIEIVRRIKAQMDIQKKIKMADYVIDNSGSLNQTRKRVKYIFQELMKVKNQNP